MLKASGSTEATSVRLGIMFSKIGLSPNKWTILAVVPAAFGFLALVYNQLLLSVVLFLVSGLIDAIDGAVARVTGSVSNFGAFLDGIVDRYVEFLLYAGLLVYVTTNFVPDLLIPHMYWAILLVFGALMPTFVRAYADHRNVVTEVEDHKKMGGLIERAERLSLLFAGMILGYFNISILVYMIATTAVLSHITALQRIVFVMKK